MELESGLPLEYWLQPARTGCAENNIMTIIGRSGAGPPGGTTSDNGSYVLLGAEVSRLGSDRQVFVEHAHPAELLVTLFQQVFR